MRSIACIVCLLSMCITAIILAVGCTSTRSPQREAEQYRANIVEGLKILYNDPNTVLAIQDRILYKKYTGK